MKFNITRPLTVSAILLPPLTGDEAPATSANGVVIAPSKAEGNPDPTLTTTAAGPLRLIRSVAISCPQSHRTVVGERIEGLRGELASLQQRINQHSAQSEELQAATTTNSQQYHGTMAAINAHLQIGTTKGNPILINTME